MPHKPLIILSLTLTLLISFDYLAAWTVPPSSPPGGNIAAPLNTGAATQRKTGVLGVNGLAVFGAQTNAAAAPHVKFQDTTASHRPFWAWADNNSFFVLHSRDANLNNFEGPHPMQIAASTTAAGDYVRFSNQVRAREYCDLNGGNCSSAADMGGGGGVDGGGLGYGQSWQVVDRVNGVWYQNTTGQPIMVFHKNIWDGTSVHVGTEPNHTTAVELNFIDFDSDLDNGTTFLVPPDHYYYFNTWTQNSSDGHRVVRELRSGSSIARSGRVTIYGVVRPGNSAIDSAQSIYSDVVSRNRVCNILAAGSTVDSYADQAFGTNSEGATIYSTGFFNGSSWQYRLYTGGIWGGTNPVTPADRFLTSITCRL